MKQFAALYTAIDESNSTLDKVAAMVHYFKVAPTEDAAWAVNFLVGRRPKRLIQSGKMQALAAEMASVPTWLFGECYDAVGDLAETIALILPDREEGEVEEHDLSWWVTERVLPLATLDETDQIELLRASWAMLDRRERFVFNKLITGAFRVGVSQELVVRALSQSSGIPVPVISHRLMGDWSPSAASFENLLAQESGDTDLSRPYPFCLAHALEGPEASLGEISDWQVEWKWDGIRSQLIRREGRSFVWSRGEELITDRFPEIGQICDGLPDGTVLDGEILAWSGSMPMKFMALQKRIGRKILSKRILEETPVVLVAFDILEFEGVDVRGRPMSERRALLEKVVLEHGISQPSLELAAPETYRGVVGSGSRLLLAEKVDAADWEELARLRQQSREFNVEGFMIKRLDSPYVAGRKKGYWWKWKIEPFTVDAVLIYAQRGSGKRASLYTDYTFGVWSDGKLVPFAKAYSGLTDEEIQRVDAHVRRTTLEKFGPVRTVEPELVMELAFEGIQLSSRHKSGVAVRFPRISRWRHDKKAADADTLENIKSMIE